MGQIPEKFQKVFSAAQIADACTRLGREVGVWARSVREAKGVDVVAVPILRGGLFFYADLVRQTDCSLELFLAQTWAYELKKNSKQREEVKVQLGSLPAKGRSILLVDDICDSGRTLQTLKRELEELGAEEVRSAVLIFREQGETGFLPDWQAFRYSGPEWFVGYGMEDQERYRNLPDVYLISQDAAHDQKVL